MKLNRATPLIKSVVTRLTQEGLVVISDVRNLIHLIILSKQTIQRKKGNTCGLACAVFFLHMLNQRNNNQAKISKPRVECHCAIPKNEIILHNITPCY